MNQEIFGIDLGTSTSEICIFVNGRAIPVENPDSKGRSPILPSAVALKKNGNLVVGEEAFAYIGDPDRFIQEFKRDMGSEKVYTLGQHTLTPEEASSLVLLQLKKMVLARHNLKVERAVISIPANYPNRAREATIRAAKLAEIEIIQLINEPTAAALAHGIENLASREKLLVFDWGGGTLDVTILEMFDGVLDVIASYGDPYLGGKDFDRLLLEHILNRFIKENPAAIHHADHPKFKGKLIMAAKATKEKLSMNEETDVFIEDFAEYQGKGIDLEMNITRNEFEKICSPLIERAKGVIEEALATKGIPKTSFDRILPVGGVTYIPAVREMLKNFFDKSLYLGLDPDLAVSIGACIKAAESVGALDPKTSLVVTDVSPNGLGIDVLAQIGNQFVLVYEPLIEPNTTIPFSIKKQYTLIYEEQDSVKLNLYQTQNANTRNLEEVIETGITSSIEGIPCSRTGRPHLFDVEFTYDKNGLIELMAMIPATGQSTLLHANAIEIQEKVRNIEKMNRIFGNLQATQQENSSSEGFSNPTEYPKKFQTVIQKAEKQLSENQGSAETRTTLKSFLDSLRSALDSKDMEKAERFYERLTNVFSSNEGTM